MKAINQFNGLNGAIQTREDIEKLIETAKAQEQFHIVRKLENVLSCYPDKNRFEIELQNPEIEALRKSDLPGIDFLEEPEEEENIGLGKAVSPDDIYQMITDKIIKSVEESNKSYKKKWKTQNEEGYLIPFNFLSKKPYRGINIALLTGGMTQVLKNPYFLTFNQIESLKGKLKKGSKGLPVVYFTMLYKVEETGKDGNKIEFGTYNKKKFDAWVNKNKSKLKYSPEYYKNSYIPILKYYNVFNGADVEGIDFGLKDFKIGYQDGSEVVKNNDSRIEIADLIVKNYPKPQPELKDSKDGRAKYVHTSDGSIDEVHMPKFEDFETGLDYYRTLLHELTHSTGLVTRLNRPYGKTFGDKKYAKEELVAEIGAIFLSAHAGIIWHNNTNHAAYLKSWNSALTHIKEDNRFLMRAASAAQASTDFILNYNKEGVPAYQKEFEKILQQKEQARVEEKAQKAKETKAKAIDEKLEKLETQLEKATAKSKTEKELAQKIAKLEDSLQQLNISVEKTGNAKAKPKSKKASLKPKVNKVTGQYALMGATACNSNATAAVEDNNPNSLAARKTQLANRTFEYYKIEDPEIAKFLGEVEIKERESVGISITAPQGAGKTRFLFQLINAFSKNYRVGHASIEEHPESSLYFNKVSEYIDEENLSNIEAPEITSMQDLHELIMRNDVIAIDSFEKLKELNSKLEVDKDLRKKYHGKLFILIFQLTSTGKMRGGSKSQFDVDIVLFTEKFDDYRQNYIYPDKNRYNQIPPSHLKYSIFNKKLLSSGEEEQEQETENKTKFEILVANRIH